MRPSEPRVYPLSDDEFEGDAGEVASRFLSKESCNTNIIRTLARNPVALEGFLNWAMYILSSKNSLPARQREIVIIRIGHLSLSNYELAQHVKISREAGLTQDEFDRVRKGADAEWNPADAALIRACDDLLGDFCVSDDVWKSLLDLFTLQQAMDAVMTGAHYLQLSMMLNSFGVQIEPKLVSELSGSLEL